MLLKNYNNIRYAGRGITGISFISLSAIFSENYLIPVISNNRLIQIIGLYIIGTFYDSSDNTYYDISNAIQFKINGCVNSSGESGGLTILRFNSNPGIPLNLFVNVNNLSQVSLDCLFYGGLIKQITTVTPAVGDTVSVYCNIQYV